MNSIEQILDYQVRRLDRETLGDVEKLHTAVYGSAPRSNFFAMKYDTGFTGARHVGFIAYNDNKQPIAFYAVIPCFTRINDQVVLAAQSADTMTHPDYRCKGLFTKLALRTFELAKDMGIRLIFGFPNQNSLPGFINKLGWQMTERMDCFRIPVSTFPWQRYLGKITGLKIMVSRRHKRLLEKVRLNRLGIVNSVFDDGFGGVYHDDQFCRYKTYNDCSVIRAGNSMIWIKTNGVLLIGDIALNSEEFANVIQHLKKLAARLGLSQIQFHASPGTTLHKLFHNDYKPIPSFQVIFKNLGEVHGLDKIKFISADIDTF